MRGLSILTAIIILQLIAGFEVRPDVRWLLRWYGVGILCVGLTGSDFLLTALELFHVRSLLALIQQALYAAGVLILIKSPKDIIWVPASILASALVTNLAGWLALWHNGFRPTLVITPRRWRAMLVPSFHYAATSMMATVYHRTGHIVVRWFLGDYALGLYTAAVRFVDILRNFVNVGLSVLMPRMALTAKSRAGLRRLVDAAVSVLVVASIPLMLGTLTTAHLVVPWVWERIMWTRLYRCAGWRYICWPRPLHRCCREPFSTHWGGIVPIWRRRRLVHSLRFYFPWILVRALGLIGVCIAFVLAEIAVGVTAYLLIPRDLKDLWRNPIIAVAGLSGLLMVAAVRLVNSYISRPVLVVAVGAAVYLIALGALGGGSLKRQFGGAK